ncbi:MAG: hypothetical protein KDB07_02485, partial [Planctomycetes bacterium]|nr:hypothetical protein [Planctomycetota bacterium]
EEFRLEGTWNASKEEMTFSLPEGKQILVEVVKEKCARNKRRVVAIRLHWRDWKSPRTYKRMDY